MPLEQSAGEAGVAGDTIRYRAITPADFHATAPPQGFDLGHGAVTCAGLRVQWLGPSIHQREDGRFEANIDRADFICSMDRDCSWWNREYPRDAHVVRHEQIHFAICEVQARRANSQADDIESRTISVAATAKQAGATAKEKLMAIFGDHQERDRTTQTAFDRETSGGRKRGRQAQWHTKLMRELDETVAHTAPVQAETAHPTQAQPIRGAGTRQSSKSFEPAAQIPTGVTFFKCRGDGDCNGGAVCAMHDGYCTIACARDHDCRWLDTYDGTAVCAGQRRVCEVECNEGNACPRDTSCLPVAGGKHRCRVPN